MKMNVLLVPTVVLVFMAIMAGAQEPMRIPFGELKARAIGPAVMSGRISSLDVVQGDPRVMWVGAASGGLWKSRTAGMTFRPVFDDQHPSIGDIAIDQQRPDTVWVGTGESWVRNSVSAGNGIYVTTDGGQTWIHKGLPESKHIAKVLLDPRDPAVVYVAVQGNLWVDSEERGVYKTMDFGATWERVLYTGPRSGAADLTMDAQNPDVLYAAMWEHRREPHFFVSGGPTSGLYKSVDGGVTWAQLTGHGLPPGPHGRMAVEVAPSSSDTVYLTLETADKETRGLYRSDDAGASWSLVNSDFNITVRPFYFSRLVVDPSHAHKIYKCGLNLTISEDAGRSFRTVGSAVHSDIHDVWVNPANTHHSIIGTDGGVYESYDGGYNYRMYGNLPIAQYYHISLDDATPYNVYGGLQDNGTWVGPSSSPGGITHSDWTFLLGGDGFTTWPHPADPDIVYGEYQGGNLHRIERLTGQAKKIRPLPDEGEPPYRFNWNSPIALSPHDKERLYFGSQFLFRSDDRGDTWTRISPDLTTNDPTRQRQHESGGLSLDNSTAENNTTIYAIAESSVQPGLLWVGTDDGLVHISPDAGATWQNVVLHIPGLPPFTWCTSIEPDHWDPLTAYVTFDGHMQGDDTPYLYRTRDGGLSWQSLATSDIEGHCWVIKQDIVNPNLLFLGTELGLYISLDGGLSWQHFRNQFPRVPVRSLAIHPRDHALVAGTHGRGIYIIDDVRPLRQLAPEMVDEDLVFLEMGVSVVPLARSGGWFGGAGFFVGANPSANARMAYYMKKRHNFGKMYVEVLTMEGELIQQLPAGKSAGINLVELPVRYPMPKAAPTNNRMALFGSVVTPSLAEGQYRVRVVKGKEVYETIMTLEEEAAQFYPAEDRSTQAMALRDLYDMTEQLGYLYYAASDILTWADSAGTGLRSARDRRTLMQFRDGLRTWRDTLVALDGDGYVAESTALREAISTLYLEISGYPGRPSHRQLGQRDQLAVQMAQHREVFRGYEAAMRKLSDKLASTDAAPLRYRSWEDYKAG